MNDPGRVGGRLLAAIRRPRREASVALLAGLLLGGPGAGAAIAQGPVYRSSMASHAPGLLVGGALAISGARLQARLGPLDAAERATLQPGVLCFLDRRWAGRWSPDAGRGSDVLLAGTLLLYPITWLAARPHQEDTAVMLMGMQTVLLTQGIVTVSKGVTGRLRPWAYLPGDPREGDLPSQARRSFLSGHTAHAFAAASFALTVRGDLATGPNRNRTVPWLLMAGAASTAALRVFAGEHFPSDVVASAAFGTLAGTLVPRFHRARTASAVTAPRIAVTPYAVRVWVPF